MFEGIFEAWPYTVLTLVIIFGGCWLCSNVPQGRQLVGERGVAILGILFFLSFLVWITYGFTLIRNRWM